MDIRTFSNKQIQKEKLHQSVKNSSILKKHPKVSPLIKQLV